MNRRGFMKSILAAGVAPYVVTTAGVLMPVRRLWKPPTLVAFGENTVEYFIQDEGWYYISGIRALLTEE